MAILSKPIGNAERPATVVAMDDNLFAIERRKGFSGWRPLPHRHENGSFDFCCVVLRLLAAVDERDRLAVFVGSVLEPSVDGVDINFDAGHGSSVCARIFKWAIGSAELERAFPPIASGLLLMKSIVRETGSSFHFLVLVAKRRHVTAWDASPRKDVLPLGQRTLRSTIAKPQAGSLCHTDVTPLTWPTLSLLEADAGASKPIFRRRNRRRRYCPATSNRAVWICPRLPNPVVLESAWRCSGNRIRGR